MHVQAEFDVQHASNAPLCCSVTCKNPCTDFDRITIVTSRDERVVHCFVLIGWMASVRSTHLRDIQHTAIQISTRLGKRVRLCRFAAGCEGWGTGVMRGTDNTHEILQRASTC